MDNKLHKLQSYDCQEVDNFFKSLNIHNNTRNSENDFVEPSAYDDSIETVIRTEQLNNNAEPERDKPRDTVPC
jgi:hypothetical protein